MAGNRLLNLKKSLDNYFLSNFTLAPIDYMGQTLDKTPNSVTQWVRFSEVGPDPTPRGTMEGVTAFFQQAIIDVACFAKIPSTDMGAVHKLADAVILALERKNIPLVAYDLGGTPTAQYIRVFEAQMRYMGLDNSLGFAAEYAVVVLPCVWDEKQA